MLMVVGRVGIEPTVFLMCLIYSQVRSPSTHTCPNNGESGKV